LFGLHFYPANGNAGSSEMLVTLIASTFHCHKKTVLPSLHIIIPTNTYLGSFFLDIKSLSLGAIWNFSKGKGFP